MGEFKFQFGKRDAQRLLDNRYTRVSESHTWRIRKSKNVIELI
jgi:hypothetical protein